MTVSIGSRAGSRAVRPPGAPPPRRGPRTVLARWDVKFSPYLFISPYFLLFFLFGLFPMGYTVWVALHDWELLGTREFVGLENFRLVLTDPQFWNAVRNTLGMFVIATVPQLLLALVLANALNQRMRARTLVRMGVLVPMVTSIAAVAIVFGQLFSRDFGMVNWVLGWFGVENLDWTARRWTSWLAISVMVDWRWTGYNALIYLAAMQSVPRDLYEAAAIDGASRVRQFWSITLPMLRPTIIFTAIVSTIGGFQLFTEPLLFGNGDMAGGSLRQFQTVTMYMFENAFRRFDYGYASAVSWMIFMLILLGSLLNFVWLRRMGGTK
ncbi:sugar ABC transporter permease [Actinomadura sp. 6K520]|jgi:cellobiose transport system permease protein|uniref:carbohydrate ABC transporter permease n=1 Tax=Actinomadura sp. 6K520 TaxID=2530364 RepID=UPI001044A035|nr:sugar ABC transporter permease [Actinomadura sp. 6K520]TDE36500.1 sugar ABC transporter permease [Actinomadura sp. 6K520]